MALIPEDLHLPAPIAEFCKLVTDAVTPQGDVVRLNVPDSGILQINQEAGDGRPEILAGTFGQLQPANHNSYECYMSPYVTSQLVIATVEQNQNNQFGPWTPIPANLIPAGAVPNENLLGYRTNLERLC